MIDVIILKINVTVTVHLLDASSLCHNSSWYIQSIRYDANYGVTVSCQNVANEWNIREHYWNRFWDDALISGKSESSHLIILINCRTKSLNHYFEYQFKRRRVKKVSIKFRARHARSKNSMVWDGFWTRHMKSAQSVSQSVRQSASPSESKVFILPTIFLIMTFSARSSEKVPLFGQKCWSFYLDYC